jgi:hypothetical protein
MGQRRQCLNGASGWFARNAAAAMSTWWLPERGGEADMGRSILRDDLLDPYACVEWAVGQLDVFNERIARWIDSRPYAVTANKDPQSGEDVWDVREVEPIPRLINAEAGAIINSLRSSLDLLANKLAERNGQIGKRDVYFPVCSARAAFQDRGRKQVKRLSAADRAAIERLQPYHGGDVPMLLWSLHDLDITRKHRRLVEAYSSPHGIGVYRYGSISPEFDELMRTQPPNDGYVFPRGAANPEYHIQVRIEISLGLGHIGPLATKPIVPALRKLADTTKSIIDLFDA